jgi:hypothetical protein
MRSQAFRISDLPKIAISILLTTGLLGWLESQEAHASEWRYLGSVQPFENSHSSYIDDLWIDDDFTERIDRNRYRVYYAAIDRSDSDLLAERHITITVNCATGATQFHTIKMIAESPGSFNYMTGHPTGGEILSNDGSVLIASYAENTFQYYVIGASQQLSPVDMFAPVFEDVCY